MPVTGHAGPTSILCPLIRHSNDLSQLLIVALALASNFNVCRKVNYTVFMLPSRTPAKLSSSFCHLLSSILGRTPSRTRTSTNRTKTCCAANYTNGVCRQPTTLMVVRVIPWGQIKQRSLCPFLGWRRHWVKGLRFRYLNRLCSSLSLTTRRVEPVSLKMPFAPPTCFFRISWLFTAHAIAHGHSFSCLDSQSLAKDSTG
jgi:hypothetical protein